MKSVARAVRGLVAGLFALVIASCGAVAPAAATANVSNYMDQGGATWHVGGTLSVDSGGVLTADKGSATANAGNSYAVTANNMAVIITTDSLSTAAGSSRSITLTDSKITANSLIQVTWAGGTNTAGTPVISAVPTAGSLAIVIYNKHASTAFNGTMIVHVLVL